MGARGARGGLLVGLIGLDSLLFLIPVIEGDTTVSLILLGILTLVAAVILAPRRVSRTASFFIVISLLLVAWEGAKALVERLNYAIVTPQPAFTYTAYASLDEALTALETGTIEAIVADENDLEDLMPVYPRDSKGRGEGAFPYPNLRYLSRLQLQEYVAFFPLTPDMPGRLSIAVRSEDAAQVSKPSDLLGQPIGAVTGDFALDKYLAAPRALVLLDLKILNNLNLPHLQAIAQAFLQPARRNGEFLLVRILSEAALYTLREAVFGFVFGALLGLLLGTAFAHSPLMERALLPYVVASQTIPILAIAPMVVIWLGASFASVAVIATYITFFPVTINTLRGLQSPHPTALELMNSYAATRWMTLWKLRFPAAVPYIFAALKVSATASVVGAIIGELPSGMGDGLGRAILDFSSDYSLTSTPKLWAAIVTAALIGVLFFIVVGVVERVALRRYVRGV
ncbi:ABC transporter permease [bacterium]|nr:ABC transporter permease [bacterium]